MKTYAIVPVKELDLAKSRLADCLPPEGRKGLLQAMLDDVLAALKELPTIVISPEDLTAHLKDRGVVFLRQRGSNDLNSAVVQANRRALEKGAEATLFVPADMPLITGEEINSVLRLGEKYNAVVTHATDGGTGILYRRPPDVMESVFTKDSFDDHQKEAVKRGVEMHVLDSFPLATDIDTLEDIKCFMEFGKGTRTYEYLSSCGF